jgi:hypothetical protein
MHAAESTSNTLPTKPSNARESAPELTTVAFNCGVASKSFHTAL